MMMMKADNFLARQIALRLRRTPSNITRELKRFGAWSDRPASLANSPKVFEARAAGLLRSRCARFKCRKPSMGCKVGRYAHARQFKRMRCSIKRQRTIVGHSLQREIERKASVIGQAVREALAQTLSKAARILAQSGLRKLYDFHASEVDCISKGKAKTPYEFGAKVGIASTLKGNLIVGDRAFHGNPYDGHTLREQLEQAAILMLDSNATPATAFVDLGYRGVDTDNPNVHIVHRGKDKRISEQDRRLLKWRQAIEPIIGRLKADHRMDRRHLKGEQGDRLHAVLCAAGYNIRWLLRMIVKKEVAFLQAVLLCLQHASAQWRSWAARIRLSLCPVPILGFGTLVRA